LITIAQSFPVVKKDWKVIRALKDKPGCFSCDQPGIKIVVDYFMWIGFKGVEMPFSLNASMVK